MRLIYYSRIIYTLLNSTLLTCINTDEDYNNTVHTFYYLYSKKTRPTR